MMLTIKRASDVSPFPLVPVGAAYVPILLSQVEQEQRLSGNGDSEAIVVGAGLCDGEGESAYTGYAPHFSFSISLIWKQFAENQKWGHIRGTCFALHHSYIIVLSVFLQFQNSTISYSTNWT